LHNDYCENCREFKLNLNADEKAFKQLDKDIEAAYKNLYENKGYKPVDIAQFKAVVDTTYAIFKEALLIGISDSVLPAVMLKSLQNDIFVFSALKTHAQLYEASRNLLDAEGKIKPFQKFSQDVAKIKKEYNENYLEAEYNFATSSAQMSAKWIEVEANADRYNLQYRTAEDDKVRKDHQELANITLPATHDFWDKYYPPNGWRCRCIAIEVRKSKFEITDEKKAMEKGDKATTQIGKDGKNRMEIFRFNPGKSKVAFPPNHPYSKVQGARTVEKEVSKMKKPK